MAAAVASLPAAPTSTQYVDTRLPTCPHCESNSAFGEGAQKRIRELESQVKMLQSKATAAVDRCADYEDQLRNLKSPPNSLIRSNTTESGAPAGPFDDEARPSTANSTSAKPSRFSFLTARRGSPAQLLPSAPPPADSELLEQLEKERALRTKAEEKVRKADIEIEELSVQLFSQANEMVASERKARAKLEARVEQLERKDKDKMARLERLEKAVSRIDRVKAMLAAPPNAAPIPRKL